MVNILFYLMYSTHEIKRIRSEISCLFREKQKSIVLFHRANKLSWIFTYKSNLNRKYLNYYSSYLAKEDEEKENFKLFELDDNYSELFDLHHILAEKNSKLISKFKRKDAYLLKLYIYNKMCETIIRQFYLINIS